MSDFSYQFLIFAGLLAFFAFILFLFLGYVFQGKAGRTSARDLILRMLDAVTSIFTVGDAPTGLPVDDETTQQSDGS